MNIIKLLLMLAVLCFASCKSKKQREPKSFLINNNNFDEPIEMLHGKVREVSTGNPTSKSDYYYAKLDTLGNMVSSAERYESYHEMEDIKATYSFIRQNGKITAIVAVCDEYYGSSPLRKGKAKWELDTTGNITRAKSDLWFGLNEYKYDSSRHIKLKNYYGKMETPYTYKYQYNANNRIAQAEWYDPAMDGGKLRTRVNFEYLLFDEYQNWTKRAMRVRNYNAFMPKDTTYIISRKIAYY